MILICNSCDKKFVVPDGAITASGRMVQCGSCGNKWKQFPTAKPKKQESIKKQENNKINTENPKKTKNKGPKKSREVSLYSPEYLAKKHGIKLNESNKAVKKKDINNKKISFGFYNSLILFIVVIICLSRILYFSQDIIVSKFPVLQFYINYYFESIRNLYEIWKDLVTSY